MYVLDGATRELKAELEARDFHFEDSFLPKVKFLIPHTLLRFTATKIQLFIICHLLAHLKARNA